MKGNEYNDLWVILNNLPEEAMKAIPGKYMDFVKSAMIKDAESNIDTEKPLEEQTLSSEVRGHLACLNLTYWAKDPDDRYEFAEIMHKNELAYEGKTEPYLKGEDYQNLLEVFDEWEEMFGPIPFWAESRGWQPWRCYEIVPEEEAEIVAGKTGLKRVEVSKKQRDQILEEAKEWVLVADTKEEETLLWHDDDYSVWTSTEEIKDFYKQYVVIRDGHFFGALIEIEDVSSYGMSVNRSSEWGVLFTDGSTDGEIKKYFSHCSTEVDRSEETTYSLKRK